LGAKEVVNAAFFGSKMLPPGDDAAFVSGQLTWRGGEDWWEVLGVSENAPTEVVRGAYRAVTLATVVSRRSLSGSSRRMTPGWLRDEAQL
jgi:hypothetical protein